MSKCVSFYVVFVFSVALFMTAGCAKQDIKKDEGIAPDLRAGQVKSEPSGSKEIGVNATPLEQAAKTAQTPSQTESAQQLQNASLQFALEKIYFDFDSAILSEASREELAKNAAKLTKETTSTIRIEGNCDERGSAEYNLALGERRAKAAQQYLVTMGVKPDRLSIISYGEEQPAIKENNEAAWAKNRRDEFQVISK